MPVTFNADAPAISQNDPWSCAPTSLRWAMAAMGAPVDEGWMEDTVLAEGVVKTSNGLQDATGAGLAAFVKRHFGGDGFEANNEPSITFDQARFEGMSEGKHAYPVLIGGRNWNHWSAVRGYDEAQGVLLLANPAGNWKDVGQSMTRAEFDRLGDFSMVRVWHPDLLVGL